MNDLMVALLIVEVAWGVIAFIRQVRREQRMSPRRVLKIGGDGWDF